MNTKRLANLIGVKDTSIHASLCRKGHWCGIRPRKLPNRFLDWPDAEVERVLGLPKSAADRGQA